MMLTWALCWVATMGATVGSGNQVIAMLLDTIIIVGSVAIYSFNKYQKQNEGESKKASR